MKNLIVAVACLLVLAIPWLLYEDYSTSQIREYSASIEEDIIPAIKSGDWDAAKKHYDIFYESWESFKSLSEFFLDADSVNRAGEMVVKTKEYIATRDASNAAAGSAELMHMMKYLHENEKLSIGNIF
ncbi:MAG: DUF4363 family protein [Anaerovoracaceae bacterium]|nr:DUF4363 family protein [Anaerovoracaceae bacterium]